MTRAGKTLPGAYLDYGTPPTVWVLCARNTRKCSAEIRARWSDNKMPPPLIRVRKDRKSYVLDGQLRVIRHCYQCSERGGLRGKEIA